MPDRDDDDPTAALRPEDLDLDAFTDAVLARLAAGDDDGLRELGDAVMAPIFVERYIDDIRAGNEWNDVLYLAARKLTGLHGGLGHLRPSLEAKEVFVTQRDTPFEDLVHVERQGDQLRIRPR